MTGSHIDRGDDWSSLYKVPPDERAIYGYVLHNKRRIIEDMVEAAADACTTMYDTPTYWTHVANHLASSSNKFYDVALDIAAKLYAAWINYDNEAEHFRSYLKTEPARKIGLAWEERRSPKGQETAEVGLDDWALYD